jgi:bifunctional non-homologous end joining protein LigD
MQEAKLPSFIPPMMAKIAEEPFDSPDWIFEVKLDGYRGIAVFDAAGKPHLWSRNGLPLEKKFPAVAKALSNLKLRSTILDGEVVAVDENGIPRFQLLQRFQKQPTAPTLYYVFDVLWCDGEELVGRFLSATKDPRQVVTDVNARYYGLVVNDQSLTPGANPRIGATSFEDWLQRYLTQNKN